jgi:hypothetical protein
VHVRVVLERRPRFEAVNRVESRSAHAFGNLAGVAVDRIGRERRQRLARAELHARADVEPNRERVGAEQLDLIRPVERQWPLAEISEVADVAAVAELRSANGRVARIVGREVVERRDARIGLAVVVTVRSLECSTQLRVAIRRLQPPVVAQPLVGRDFDCVVAVNRTLEAGAEIALDRRVRSRIR